MGGAGAAGRYEFDTLCGGAALGALDLAQGMATMPLPEALWRYNLRRKSYRYSDDGGGGRV